MARAHLAVVIPAYNEEQRLGPTLEAAVAFLSQKSYDWRLTVVSDGSQDSTLAVALQAASAAPQISVVDSQPNRGKGYVVRQGVLAAEAEWILFCDADLATPIEEIDKLLEAAGEGREVVIGSRPLRESRLEVRQPLWREMGGRAFNLFIQAVGVWGVQDTQCGFKLFSRRAAQDIFSRCSINGWGFDFEAMMIARDLGYTITEVGVRWRHVEGSKFEPMKEAPRMLRELFRLRMAGRGRRTAAKPQTPLPAPSSGLPKEPGS